MISSKIEEDYVEVCEKAAAIGEIKRWISKDTWEAIVQRTEENIQAEGVNRNCRRELTGCMWALGLGVLMTPKEVLRWRLCASLQGS